MSLGGMVDKYIYWYNCISIHYSTLIRIHFVPKHMHMFAGHKLFKEY